MTGPKVRRRMPGRKLKARIYTQEAGLVVIDVSVSKFILAKRATIRRLHGLEPMHFEAEALKWIGIDVKKHLNNKGGEFSFITVLEIYEDKGQENHPSANPTTRAMLAETVTPRAHAQGQLF